MPFAGGLLLLVSPHSLQHLTTVGRWPVLETSSLELFKYNLLFNRTIRRATQATRVKFDKVVVLVMFLS